MTTESTPALPSEHRVQVRYQGGSSGVYGLGLIGAWVYYIGRATTNEQRVVGFLKGLVWPAFLVYDVFVFLEKR